MSETVEKRIGELFEPINGNSKYTKAYCQNNPGEYIVYTGTTIGVFGKINKADYTTPQLTFTTDGENAGTIEYITDKGYCIGGHRTILKPLVENIDLLYFKYVLQPLFFKNVKKGEVPSLHFNRIKNLKIQIPVLPDKRLNLEKQKEIALKFQDIEEKKEVLLNKIDILNKYTVLIDEDECKYKDINFNEMFKLERGKIISKPYILEHSGDFPVYSTQKGIYGRIDTYMKEGKFLLWNTDGLAGYIKITSGKFSYTNIVGIMVPTNKIDMNNISLEYLKIYLEPIFRANRKGRMGINGKNEYTKLNSTMIRQLNIQIPIPINENGDYDIEKQNELAQKYATIESIKQNLNTQVKELVSIIVN